MKATRSKQYSNIFFQAVLFILLFRFHLQFICFKVYRNILPTSLSKKFLHILLMLSFFKHLRHCYLAQSIYLFCGYSYGETGSQIMPWILTRLQRTPSNIAISFLYFYFLLCTSVFKHVRGLSVHVPSKASKLKINTSHHSFMPQPQHKF